MAKDPAVLFYTSDFLTGTMTMTNEEIGMYIRLLCLQHQKGRLTEKDMLFICNTYVEAVFDKFKKNGDGLYYNDRLEKETIKRKEYSESRRRNISKRYEPTYVEHMENENVNVNVNVNRNVNKDIKRKEKRMDDPKKVTEEYFLNLLPIDSNQIFIDTWVEWVDFRKEIKKKLTKSTAKKQIDFLIKQPNPIECMNISIKNGWQGLFETDSKVKTNESFYTYREMMDIVNDNRNSTKQTDFEFVSKDKWKRK